MKIRMLLLLLFLTVACTSQAAGTVDPDTAVTRPTASGISTNEPPASPFSPKPGDEKLSRGSLFLREVSLVIRESYPPQVSLALGGDLPTACHELRVEIIPPDTTNKIVADAYSIFDPNMACAQALKPFQEYVDIGTYPAGHYSVWVNGELAGEFDT